MSSLYNHRTCPSVNPDSKACDCCCTGCEFYCEFHNPLANHECFDYEALGIKPSRIWWSGGGCNAAWWKIIVLDGIHGGDEWCNRTIGLKLWRGALFLNLNFPMRRDQCEECKNLDNNPLD